MVHMINSKVYLITQGQIRNLDGSGDKFQCLADITPLG